MIAKLFVTNNPEPLTLDKSGSDVLYHLDENRLQDMPVVENGQLIGSVTEANVFTMEDPDLPLRDQKLALKNVSVYDHQHIFEVVSRMASSKLTLMPVINDKEQYIGSISLETLVEPLAGLLAVGNPGAIIVLELNQNDYVLSEIAQIVESQDSKILSLFLSPASDSTRMDLTIKINSMEIQTLLTTFNRYNYIVKATYTEDEDMYNDLKDRYDSLMKYLSI